MLRRLTNLEYRNTLRALLNLPATPTETVAESDPLTGGFDNISASLMVSPSLGARYADTARNLAQSFTVPACAGADEMACASSFIAEFGKRAHRRPLTSSEAADYEALYADQRTRTDYAGGIRQVVQTILQSPYVLYRFELGVEGAERTLTPHEVATQLAYMLTASPPDDALLAAADRSALGTPAALEAEARRLLSLPEARQAVRRLLGGYVGVLGLSQVNKDAEVYPSFTPSLRASMQMETELFIDSVVFEGDGTLRSLFTAPHSLVNGELSALYGLGGSTSQDFARATLDASERMGILTHASVLSVEAKPGSSDPVKRGKFIRVNLLCGSLPAPPAIVPELAPPDPNLTTRERFAQHSSDPACAGCHSLIDPIGFGLENYDGIGQYRTQENGLPVDAAGMITGTQATDGPFRGGVELAAKLGGSLEVGQCLTRKAYRWAFGRVENENEQAVIQNIAAPLAAGGLDIREVLLGVIKSDNFTYRTFR